MKNKMYNYILFVFAKSKNQDDFVTEIAEEIAVITKSKNIRYYYGPEACVFTFGTLDDLKSVAEYVDIILSEGEISYFLLPYHSDNMSFGLPKDISDHLFSDKMSGFGKKDDIPAVYHTFSICSSVATYIFLSPTTQSMAALT